MLFTTARALKDQYAVCLFKWLPTVMEIMKNMLLDSFNGTFQWPFYDLHYHLLCYFWSPELSFVRSQSTWTHHKTNLHKTRCIYRSTLVSSLRRLTFTASETRSETICSRLQQYLLLRKMSGGKTSKSTNVVFEEKQGRLFSTGISRVFS